MFSPTLEEKVSEYADERGKPDVLTKYSKALADLKSFYAAVREYRMQIRETELRSHPTLIESFEPCFDIDGSQLDQEQAGAKFTISFKDPMSVELNKGRNLSNDTALSNAHLEIFKIYVFFPIGKEKSKVPVVVKPAIKTTNKRARKERNVSWDK